MKTFLQLCKDVCREGSVPNGEDAISSVDGNTGQLARIVGYVRSEWVKLQNRHQSTGLHWRWMRSRFEIETVASNDTYVYGDATDTIAAAAISRFRNWMIKDCNDPPRLYRQSTGIGTQTWLVYIDWDDFKYLYRMGTQNPGHPHHITISPQNEIVLGPVPNDVYVIQGDYMKGVHRLVADGDQPDLPEDFEDVLVYGALSRFGLQKNASEVVTYAQDELATLLGDLEDDQLSEIPIGAPLA